MKPSTSLTAWLESWSPKMKKICALLGLLLLMNLAACASKEEEKSDEAKQEAELDKKEAQAKAAAETYKPKLICPQVAILRDLGTLRDFGKEKPAATQLVAAARMHDIGGDCGYQDKGIDIAFRVSFTAVKGPHLSGDRAQFPFFIAVVNPNGEILNKDQMTEEFYFKTDDTKTVTREEPLHVFIPMPKEKHADGPNYRVLIGFQLTEEQLNDIRSAENKKSPP